MYKSCIKKTNMDIADQRKVIATISELIEKKRQELNNAAIEKKVMTKLQEKDRKKVCSEVTKRHHKEMDDVAVLRHSRG